MWTSCMQLLYEENAITLADTCLSSLKRKTLERDK